MQTEQIVELPDFDTLAKLAVDDPAAFEALRAQLLQQAIDSAPANLREGLSRTVDQLNTDRASARTPMEAAASANKAMLSSFTELNVQMGRAHFALQDLGNSAANLAAQQNPDGGSKRTFIK